MASELSAADWDAAEQRVRFSDADASLLVAFTSLILEAEGTKREGTAETPHRAMRAWRDLTSGYDCDDKVILKTFDSEGHDEIVLVKDIPFHSLCEHHLLPFLGVCHVAYIPDGRIVGLSKIPRLVEAYTKRLQVQERVTSQIAESLQKHLDPRGVLVIMEAEHLCMTMRGVQKAGSRTTTSVVRGIFKDDPRARQEALSLIHAN